jgi:hypothetical protein
MKSKNTYLCTPVYFLIFIFYEVCFTLCKYIKNNAYILFTQYENREILQSMLPTRR